MDQQDTFKNYLIEKGLLTIPTLGVKAVELCKNGYPMEQMVLILSIVDMFEHARTATILSRGSSSYSTAQVAMQTLTSRQEILNNTASMIVAKEMSKQTPIRYDQVSVYVAFLSLPMPRCAILLHVSF